MDATIIRSFRQSYFHFFCRRRIAGTLARHRPIIGDVSQRGKMATLLKSLFFVFKISFLPNYRVKYYDYDYCSKVLEWYNM